MVSRDGLSSEKRRNTEGPRADRPTGGPPLLHGPLPPRFLFSFHPGLLFELLFELLGRRGKEQRPSGEVWLGNGELERKIFFRGLKKFFLSPRVSACDFFSLPPPTSSLAH